MNILCKLNGLPHLFVSIVFLISIISCGGGYSSVDDDGNGGGITGNGVVQVIWETTTENADDSCSDDIAGYQISYGTSSGRYSDHVAASQALGNINCQQSGTNLSCGTDILTCSYELYGLSEGTWFFALKTTDDQGNFSDYSNERLVDVPD